MSILDSIQSREDLLKLDDKQLAALCADIRAYMIRNVAKTGGHLASNLGVVELTVAIHRVFDTSVDRLVFDVGHQSYVHKILTGRKDAFPTLRQFGGLAGFPKPNESVHDAFIAGHASAAVSSALGMARARTLQHKDYHVITLMGDGALTGGLAYEGLNNAGDSKEPLIVILNDNGMSITRNVGGMARHLSNIRTRQSYYRIKRVWREITRGTKFGQFCYRKIHRFKESLKRSLISSNMFDDMGFEYIGPVDGHDIKKVSYLLEQAKQLRCPVVLHVLTKKGKGYPPAEISPDSFHGVGHFDPETGIVETSHEVTFSDTFGCCLTDLASRDERICTITAAMESGTGLDNFHNAMPERFFDVGIAEGHAVSMAGGLAKQGMIPVVAIYSTFLQRAYDMILHDVALLGLHVVFAVDRAGLVGSDGETHHGVFDVSYLRQVPGMTILCPSNQKELGAMLHRAILELDGPVAIRYPRGGDGHFCDIPADPVLRDGDDLTLCGYGTLINEILDAAELLEQSGIKARVVKLDQIKPIPPQMQALLSRTPELVIAEEVISSGSVYEALSALLEIPVYGINLGDRFVTHGDVRSLYDATGLSAAKIAEFVKGIHRQ